MLSVRHHLQTQWFLRGSLIALAWMAFAWQSAAAAEPRRELWDLVHKDAGLAIEARNLTEQSRQFVESELFRRIQRHSAWQQLIRGPEAKHFEQIRQTVNDVTKTPLLSWMDKLFGHEIILCLTPQASGRPRSVLLTRLKRPADLPEILAAWEKLEPRTETRLQHRGVEYFRRIKADQHDPLFYVLIDDVLILSDQAESLTPVLDLTLDQHAENTIPKLPSFQKLLQVLSPASVVRVVIQPSAWRVARSTTETQAKDPVERWIQQAFDDCEIIGFGLRFESGLVAEVVAIADDLGSSPNWLKIVEKTSGAPAFLKHVPQSAVALIAGRHDLGSTANWILSQLSEEQSKKLKNVRQVLRGILLGNDLFDDVLPSFPGDFGGYVVPRAEWQLTSIPVDGLVAMALPPQQAVAPPTAKPTTRQALENAVTTGVSLILALHNGNADQAATLEQQDFNGTAVRWIQNIGPIQPAYAVTGDYFLFASSPQLIRDFLSQSLTNTLTADERFQKLNADLFADASQIAVLRGALVRAFLAEHREFLLKQLETAHKLKPEAAARRLDRMLEWIQLADQLVLASSLHADHVKVVLALNVFDVRPTD